MNGVTPVGIGLNPPATGSALSSGPATPPAPGTADYVLSGVVPADLPNGRTLLATTPLTQTTAVAGAMSIGIDLAALIAALGLAGFSIPQVVISQPSVAQMQAILTTPIDLVAAVPGKIHFPLFFWGTVQQNASGITTAPNVRIQYPGNSTNLTGSILGGTNQTDQYHFYWQIGTAGTDLSVANVLPAQPVNVNKALRMIGGSNMTGGTGSKHTFGLVYMSTDYLT